MFAFVALLLLWGSSGPTHPGQKMLHVAVLVTRLVLLSVILICSSHSVVGSLLCFDVAFSCIGLSYSEA